MLYLVIGSNKEKIDKEIIKVAGKSDILKMDAFNFDADLARSNASGASLFGGDESINVLYGISESPENFDILKSLLSGFAESSNKFFIVESDLNKEDTKLFEKSGAKVLNLEEKTAAKSKWGSAEGSNPFAIADAVGKRSPKEAWIEYRKLRNNEEEPEEIHGRIIGKVRDILSSEVATAEEIGMHPFVYRKAKMDLKNWNKDKLREFYDRLVYIYHKSRMGGEELDIALEKELLQI